MNIKQRCYSLNQKISSALNITGHEKVDYDSEYFKNYNSCRPNGPDKRYCFAPVKNLYFGQDGEVASCCAASYVSVYGFYPEKTIKQLWKSTSAYEMRASVATGNIAPSCHLCFRQMKEENHDVTYSHIYDRSSVHKKYPVMMEFYLSNTCNLECIMCSSVNSSLIAKKENNVPGKKVYDQRFVDELEEFIPHLQNTLFFGGEPFLVPVYYTIWQKIIELNPQCNIDITTNGTILNDKVIALFEKARINMIVSLDSLQKENFERIRKNASFETVMKNFHTFHQYSIEKNTWFNISFNPMQQNWQEIPDMVRFADEMNCGVIFNRVWEPPQCSLWNWEAGKLQEVSDYLESITFDRGNEMQNNNHRAFETLKKQINSWKVELDEYNQHRDDYGNISTASLIMNGLNEYHKSHGAHVLFLRAAEKKFDQKCEKIVGIIERLKLNDYQNSKLKQLAIMQKDILNNTLYYSDFYAIERFLKFATGMQP